MLGCLSMSVTFENSLKTEMQVLLYDNYRKLSFLVQLGVLCFLFGTHLGGGVYLASRELV